MANGAGLKISGVRVRTLRWFGHPVQKWFKGSNPFPRIAMLKNSAYRSITSQKEALNDYL